MRTGRGLDRLVNFSDAIVAIAITLLVLPLVDTASDIGRLTLAGFARENIGGLLAFAISFAVIARFWVVHHRVFEWVADYSTAIVWANFLWLAAIVFIPFAANLLSEIDGDRPDVYALYIGNMLISSLAMLLIEYLPRPPRR